MDNPTTTSRGETSAEQDARYARQLAFDLEAAPPERIAALAAVLIDHVQADPARLQAAVRACEADLDRNRHHRSTEYDEGVRQAIALLHEAQARLSAGPPGPEASPRAEAARPFRWPRRRRWNPRWWLRRYGTRGVALRIRAPQSSAGIHTMTATLDVVTVGSMRYQLCDPCRLGVIGKISIGPTWQGLGLGHRMVTDAFAAHPTYRWHTTAQYPTSGTFWRRVAVKTGAEFTEADLCAHMKRDLGLG